MVKDTGGDGDDYRDAEEEYSVVDRIPSSNNEQECVTKTLVKSDKGEKEDCEREQFFEVKMKLRITHWTSRVRN